MEYRDFLAAEDKQFRAHLEEHQRVIGGVLEEVKAQGERIAEETAQTVATSGREAVSQAQASLDQVAQAARKVGELAQQASETTGKAAQRSEELLGRLDQASQRMVASGQKVEAGLDGLLPKVAGVREGLERELVDIVSEAAAAEEKVKKMVASIQASLTKEIEGELRAKLRNAMDEETHRIYRLGTFWENFHRVGVHAAMGFGMVAAGILGWWYGKHQLEADTYQKALVDVQKNAEVWAYAYQFTPDTDGIMQRKRITMDAPLAWVASGKYASMTKNAQGQWVYGNAVVDPKVLYTAMWWDASNEKKWEFVKGNQP